MIKRKHPQYSYDPACRDLAEHFLPVPEFASDELRVVVEQRQRDMAQDIQNAVESHLDSERDKLMQEMGGKPPRGHEG